jgi:hypothetical protein
MQIKTIIVDDAGRDWQIDASTLESHDEKMGAIFRAIEKLNKEDQFYAEQCEREKWADYYSDISNGLSANNY